MIDYQISVTKDKTYGLHGYVEGLINDKRFAFSWFLDKESNETLKFNDELTDEEMNYITAKWYHGELTA